MTYNTFSPFKTVIWHDEAVYIIINNKIFKFFLNQKLLSGLYLLSKQIDWYIASSHYKNSNCFLRNFLMFFKVIDGSYLYKNSCPMSRKRSTAMLLLKNNALKTLKKCNFGKFLCLHREAKINMESFFKNIAKVRRKNLSVISRQPLRWENYNFWLWSQWF